MLKLVLLFAGFTFKIPLAIYVYQNINLDKTQQIKGDKIFDIFSSLL